MAFQAESSEETLESKGWVTTRCSCVTDRFKYAAKRLVNLSKPFADSRKLLVTFLQQHYSNVAAALAELQVACNEDLAVEERITALEYGS